MQTLKLTIFKDGRPGHEKQTQGIVSALKNYVRLETTCFDVAHNNFFLEMRDYLRFFLHQEKYPGKDNYVDLIIGTGSRTHIPMLSCKRQCKARAIVSMAPARLLRRYFDLCFVPIHDRLEPEVNIFQTIGPPNNSSNKSMHRDNKSLILIGGVDSRSHHWDQDEIIDNIEQLINHTENKIWVISSSPRTPSETEIKLEELAAKKSNVSFYPFSETVKGWVEQQYNENKVVWITADSISMVYEALSAGCRVGILPVKWKNKRCKFQFSERYLVEQKRVISFSDWRNGRAQWSEGKPFNEADRCAREILQRWWPESLQ